MRANCKENWMTETQKDKIIAMYQEGKLSYSEIAQRVGRERASVVSFIRRAIKKGEITPRTIEKANKLKATAKKHRIKLNNVNQEFQPDGVCVNCTREISDKCVYGAKNPDYLCDFYEVTGYTRLLVAPDHTKCTAFVSIENATRKKKRTDGFGREQFYE